MNARRLAYMRRYQKKNRARDREKKRKSHAKWMKKNRDHVRKYFKEYQAKNREKINRISRKWYWLNKLRKRGIDV